jgi:hypothetical protein
VTADRDALLDLLGAIELVLAQPGVGNPRLRDTLIPDAAARARRHLDRHADAEAGQRLLDAAEVRRGLAAGFAPRHLRAARTTLARGHALDGTIDPPVEEKVARAIADAERRGEAEAVVALRADRVTTEPTTLTAERDLHLAPGQVCMSLRPFPSTNDSPEVVLYGTPEQLVDLFDSCGSFVEDVTP